MKTCTKCGLSEPQVAFQAQRRQCVECRRKYMREYLSIYSPAYYRANKDEVNRKVSAINLRRRHDRYAQIKNLKEASPCLDCGQHFPYFVMDFDHRDRKSKTRDVSAMVKQMFAWPTVLAEIEKCDLVCTNCHRLRTYKGQSCYKTRRFEYHRAILDELKSSTPCLDCGGTFQPCQMDFDHLDPKFKVATIARLVEGPTELLLNEIEKCHLICANCHRIRGNTGIRPVALEHGQEIVRKFQVISARTPYPEDQRVAAFPLPHLLGGVPDKELSAMTGISRDMVAWYRRKAGIVLTRQGERVQP